MPKTWVKSSAKRSSGVELVADLGRFSRFMSYAHTLINATFRLDPWAYFPLLTNVPRLANKPGYTLSAG